MLSYFHQNHVRGQALLISRNSNKAVDGIKGIDTV